MNVYEIIGLVYFGIGVSVATITWFILFSPMQYFKHCIKDLLLIVIFWPIQLPGLTLLIWMTIIGNQFLAMHKELFKDIFPENVDNKSK